MVLVAYVDLLFLVYWGKLVGNLVCLDLATSGLVFYESSVDVICGVFVV